MLKRLYVADVGGVAVPDGHTVRMGLLYRSSAINKLSAEELARLQGLHLRHIIDLREPAVVVKRPDLIKTEAVTLLPVGFGVLETVRMQDVFLRRVNWGALAHARLYADVLEENGPLFKQFLDSLLDKPGPALVHCTAGKDRTGMMVAVLDLALGVPRDEIVKRYMAVAPHLTAYFPRRLKWLVQALGAPPLTYSVIAEYMEGLVDHIGEKYGGAAGYLGAIGFERAEALRAQFLE
jgi:protein-tyrosine phosphatase